MATTTQSTKGSNPVMQPIRSIPQPTKQASTAPTAFSAFVARSAVARRSMS